MIHEVLESTFAEVFAVFMGRKSGFAGTHREELETLCRSLICGMQGGNTCLPLKSSQEKLLASCPLVSPGGDTPLVVSNNSLYLARYYSYESRLAQALADRAAVDHDIEHADELLNLCFPSSAAINDQQREAARVALNKGVCIISGGPGTGKTTTVVKIVSLLVLHYGPDLQIALSAPTGKAAIRLKESVSAQIPSLSVNESTKQALPQHAQTLHRLLGGRMYSPLFKYNNMRRLPWDVVIVDEASMVDIALMSKLVDALSAGARLILLGDKGQLASVESGAVLAECISVLPENVVELNVAHRFNSDISELADHVNKGDGEAAVEVLEEPGKASVVRAGPDWIDECAERYERYLTMVRDVKRAQQLPELFELFSMFRILCALRKGMLGVAGLNSAIERSLAARGFDCTGTQWYQGRPVIITRNDYNLGLYNGDIGICLPEVSGTGELNVWFQKDDGLFNRLPPNRLPSHETAWAMTVHKSQGSEFKEIVVALPERDNRILSRELLYTAITRARERVVIRGSRSLIKQVVGRKVNRTSGLADQIRRYRVNDNA